MPCSDHGSSDFHCRWLRSNLSTASIGPWPSMGSLEALARHHELGGWEPIGFHLSFWWGVVVHGGPCHFFWQKLEVDSGLMAGYHAGKVLDVSEIENLLLHFTEANKKYATLRHCSLMLFSEARKIRKLVMWMMWMWWQAGSDSEVPQWLPGN